MGRASDPRRQFQRALKSRRFDDAMMLAQGLEIGLEEAARLTLLAAAERSPRYEQMAIRLIRLLLDERDLKIHQLCWLAERFQDAGEGRVQEAERGLMRFITDRR